MVSEDAYYLLPGSLDRTRVPCSDSISKQADWELRLPLPHTDYISTSFDAIYSRLTFIILTVLFLLGLFMNIWYRFVSNSSLDGMFNADSSITGPMERRSFRTRIFNYFIALFGCLSTAVSLYSTFEFVTVLMSLDNFNLYDLLLRDGFPPEVDFKHRLWAA
jgi:hypothetical protein